MEDDLLVKVLLARLTQLGCIQFFNVSSTQNETQLMSKTNKHTITLDVESLQHIFRPDWNLKTILPTIAIQNKLDIVVPTRQENTYCAIHNQLNFQAISAFSIQSRIGWSGC